MRNYIAKTYIDDDTGNVGTLFNIPENIILAPEDIIAICLSIIGGYVYAMPESAQNDMENYLFDTLTKCKEFYHEHSTSRNNFSDEEFENE